MNTTTARIAAFALSAVMTSATVAGMNGLATRQYSKAEHIAQLAAGALPVAPPQRVVVIARRAA